MPKLFVENPDTDMGTPRKNGFAWGGDKIQVRYSAIPTTVTGKKYLSLRLVGINFVELGQREGTDTDSSPFGNATAVEASDFTGTEQEPVPAIEGEDSMPF
jgi:hypothetical protein